MKKLLLLLLFFSGAAYGQVKPWDKPGKFLPGINKPLHEPPVIINEYAAVLSYDICTNTFTVDTSTAFNVGDTVIIMQMKGAAIDTSNTAFFGTILDYKNAGNYEFNYISQKSGNELKLKNKLTKGYDIPGGVVQLIRVPYYNNGNFVGGLTCKAWDGAKGGVLAVTAINGLTCNDHITVVGKGFRGGEGYNAILPSSNCFENNYNDSFASQLAAFKGESIASLPQNLVKGKGSLASGGGGGLSHNSGGGGGSNAGAGGFGGYQVDTCGSAPFDNRGLGGKSLLYTAAANKIFMGGGGGAGHADNANPNFPPRGAAGGGIIIMLTDTLTLYDYLIFANGDSGPYCYSLDCSDGVGGGGGGGTVLLSAIKINSPDGLIIQTPGGDGSNVIAPIVPGGKVGPGGGGGGGAFFANTSSMPANVFVQNNGGANGVIATNVANPWGATSGTAGSNYFNLVLPFDSVLFKPNIDSVRINDNVVYCNNVDFNGLGFTNTYPVASWQWDFGDGAIASTQNTNHDYTSVGTYSVKLIVTDINGCKDSITKSVMTAGPMIAEAGRDNTLCASGQISVRLNGNGTGTYSWSPATYLDNPNIPNPLATINTTTKFYLTMTNGTGCSAIDSVTITINQNPVVRTLKDTSICKNTTLVLTTTGALNYTWSPGIYVSDSTIASPRFTDSVSHTLIVTGTSANGCSAKDTIAVTVKAPRIFLAPPDKSFCFGKGVQLDGRNGNSFQYLWTPATYLSNANIVNPFANPPSSMLYSVKITDNTCDYDSSFSVNVTVLLLPVLNASKSNDINCYLPYAKLKANDASQYFWSPASTLSKNSISNPIANPSVTTTYFVTGTNNSGCSAIDSITVIADFSIGVISVPNSFTPNRDGINDCFGIKYHRDVKNLIFIIYNRFGTKVFETTNADECWNGYFKGQPADPGSYVYYLSANTLCGYIVKKGSILLIR